MYPVNDYDVHRQRIMRHDLVGKEWPAVTTRIFCATPRPQNEFRIFPLSRKSFTLVRTIRWHMAPPPSLEKAPRRLTKC